MRLFCTGLFLENAILDSRETKIKFGKQIRIMPYMINSPAFAELY